MYDFSEICKLATRKRLTRQESRARTQSMLLEAAGKTFRKLGFEGAAVEDIAEGAGFSRGAFYANFESKDDLFIALLDQEMKRHCERLKAFLGAGRRHRKLWNGFGSFTRSSMLRTATTAC